ncbi:MAG: ubiquinol-cytochrome c reductase iron-sulfur subunit, partial [Methyloceanibacter sp.]
MASSDTSADPSLDHEENDPSRRDVMMIAAGAFAAIGGAAALWPLLDQMNPDASTLSLATIEVDLAPVEEGQAITVMWRGKPVFIRNRTAEEVEEARNVELSALPDPLARNMNLADTAPATDENRAALDKEPWLVMIGVCTHLGCIPQGQSVGAYK